MKTYKLSLLAMAFMFLFTSCSKDEIETTEEANYSIDLNLAQETDWEIADQILVLINEHRVSVGLTTIQKDQQYASAYAVDHTKYMIDVNGINHDNFNIRSKALKDRGAFRVGENVANGYTSAEAVVNAWLNSSAHKAIIEGDYTHSGFGVISNQNGTYFFTQLFYSK
jgi:uncharacterized protein YkwD